VLYPTAQIERIYQNEKVEKLQKWPGESENNCELVSVKKKTFENNYSQGKSRMGMPLWYFVFKQARADEFYMSGCYILYILLHGFSSIYSQVSLTN
jgi:hypothetical protein